MTSENVATSPWRVSTSEEDVERLRTLHREFEEVNATSDPAQLAAQIAPGAGALSWFNLEGGIYGGPDLIDAWGQAHEQLGGRRAEVRSTNEEITVVGDLGWVEFQLNYKADFAEMGSVDMDVRGTEIWRRMDGDWRLVHCHFSPDVPNQFDMA